MRSRSAERESVDGAQTAAPVPAARGDAHDQKVQRFRAGGVSVAIGELADGLVIDLDKVPLKYEGLSGTELAISESQERMAVVVDAKDCDAFIALAAQENLAATPVAVVTDDPPDENAV